MKRVFIAGIPKPFFQSGADSGSGGATHRYILIQEPAPSVVVLETIPLPQFAGIPYSIAAGYVKRSFDFTWQVWHTATPYTGGTNFGIRVAADAIT